MKLHYGFNELKDFDFMAFMPMLLPFIAIGTLLVLIALMDVFRHRATRKNVLVWTCLIFFVPTLGPILYFVLGRKDDVKA
ncbi:PLD nuclease N-terminal domain-containing protein [Paenibacillus sp. 1P03SA]|uniref:PLD nuclease N-terminal domain-containing protein n=1 Tax=Paenibacillus sp. 1P03SA TaxID=3132294 RepID=UPI0039A36C43